MTIDHSCRGEVTQQSCNLPQCQPWLLLNGTDWSQELIPLVLRKTDCHGRRVNVPPESAPFVGESIGKLLPRYAIMHTLLGILETQYQVQGQDACQNSLDQMSRNFGVEAIVNVMIKCWTPLDEPQNSKNTALLE